MSDAQESLGVAGLIGASLAAPFRRPALVLAGLAAAVLGWLIVDALQTASFDRRFLLPSASYMGTLVICAWFNVMSVLGTMASAAVIARAEDAIPVARSLWRAATPVAVLTVFGAAPVFAGSLRVFRMAWIEWFLLTQGALLLQALIMSLLCALIPVAMHEGGGIRAFRRGVALTSGRRWPIIGALSAVLLLVAMAAAAVFILGAAVVFQQMGLTPNSALRIMIIAVVGVMFTPLFVLPTLVYRRLIAIKESSRETELAEVFS
jgi:hypothetical protein